MVDKISHGELKQYFALYQRWVEDGSRPYIHKSYDKDKQHIEPQFYYDNYHNCITNNGDGTFRFNFQTYDSPDGDTWVKGTFKLIEGRVSIIEQSAYAS